MGYLWIVCDKVTLFAILFRGYSIVRSDSLDITSVPSGFVQKDAKLVKWVAESGYDA